MRAADPAAEIVAEAQEAAGFLEQFQGLIGAATISQAIAVAAELRIADLLLDGPRPLAELAAAAQCDPGSLRRLLRALASHGLCSEGDNETVALLPRGAMLSSDSDSLLRSYVIWWGHYRWPAWGELLHCVRTGQCAAGTASGRVGMKELHQDAGAAQVFHGAMAGLTRVVARGVLHAWDFSKARQIVDVGGGYGELMGVVLGAHPELHGMLFDLPHALEGARNYLAQMGVAKRCELIGGNFFESVPAGADIYMLKTILHDWNDEESVAILQRCREAAAPGARLLLIEQMLPERTEPCSAHQRAALADLNMLVMLGGRERSAEEFRLLLERAGFALETIREATLGYSVLEARAR